MLNPLPNETYGQVHCMVDQNNNKINQWFEKRLERKNKIILIGVILDPVCITKVELISKLAPTQIFNLFPANV